MSDKVISILHLLCVPAGGTERGNCVFARRVGSVSISSKDVKVHIIVARSGMR